jgi:surface-anchored protein
MYTVDGFGSPTVDLGSAAGQPKTLRVAAGIHAHQNWAFTAPGAYFLTFEATGLADRPVSTGNVTYRFEVPLSGPVAPAGACQLPADQALTPGGSRVSFDVQATGANEVPPVSGYPGRATAHFVLDEARRELGYSVFVSGLSANLVSAAHIHRGAAGVNGPVVHAVCELGFVSASGRIALSDADLADLRQGNLYLNVNSIDHLGGFARAQLVLPAGSVPAAGITPPRAGDGGLADNATSTEFGGLLAATLMLYGLRTVRRAAETTGRIED